MPNDEIEAWTARAIKQVDQKSQARVVNKKFNKSGTSENPSPTPRFTASIAIAIGLLLLIALLLVGAYYLISSAGYFAKPAALDVGGGTFALSDCKGSLLLTFGMVDGYGKAIENAPLRIDIEGKETETLITDKNGKAITTKAIETGWCGKEVEVTAKFNGNNNYKAISSSIKIPVKAPTTIVSSYPENILQGQKITVNVSLVNPITNIPVSGKTISFGGQKATTNSNGQVQFQIESNSSGKVPVKLVFKGDEVFEKSELEDQIQFLAVVCQDGTQVGLCNGQYFCNYNQKLEQSCQKCGCPASLTCFKNQCLSEDERISQLIADLQKTAAKVESDSGSGSGVIISRNQTATLVLTNRHVVDPNVGGTYAAGLRVTIGNLQGVVPKKVLVAPNKLDLAILVMDPELGESAELGTDTDPKVGSSVVAIGSPLGISNSVTKGIISNFVKTNTTNGFEYEVIQVDAALNPGNSGGGIHLTTSGKLIGITSFKLVIGKTNQLSEGIGFAIPTTMLNKFPLENWIEISAKKS